MKYLLTLFTLLPLSSFASNLFISPEVKIGTFRGAGLQLGISDVAGFEHLFIDYSRVNYNYSRFNEQVDAYRLGFQHMFKHKSDMGFQASLGVANYDGTWKEERLTNTGVSIGGAYVYQVNPVLSVRAGADLDLFSSGSTHTFSDAAINFSFGFGLTL